MPEIDPLILELRADFLRTRQEMRDLARASGQGLGRVERDILRLESQMKRSSAVIAGQLRGLGASFAGLLGAREIGAAIDSFTRLQNSLRVAGLEGVNLEQVQGKLLELSTRYGVNIEGLANLYGKASDAGRSFGASEAEVLKLTEATSQSLLITGTNAQQAGGAILGLSQALASGTVRAEEFNQINEGGLRPLLQAAAAAERFGGDVNKLRAEVLAGKVSSQEFFAAIMTGAGQLETQASKATLTLSGAFEALSSRLTVYIGSAASANGVTGALAAALGLLAENLDIIIPALATVAAVMGGVMAANAIAGTRAFFALTAAMGGAATATEALAFALGTAGVGAAIVAVGAGLVYLISQSDNTAMSLDDLKGATEQNTDELGKMIGRLKAAGVNTDELGNAASRAAGKVDDLADSYRQALIEARNFSKETAGGKIQKYNDDIIASQRRQATQAEYIRALRAANPGAIKEGRKSPQLIQAEDKLAAERKLEASLRDLLETRAVANANGVDVDGNDARTPTPTPSGKPKRTPASRGQSGPTQAEKDARAAEEEAALRIEQLRAQARLTDDIYERSNLQQQILAEERAQRESDIDAKVKSKALTEAQAAEQRKMLDALYGQRITEDGSGDIIVEKQKSLYGQAIAREEQAELARQTTDAMRDELDALGAEAGLEDNRRARVALERTMLDLSEQIARSMLEERIARGDVADAAKARSALERQLAAERAGFEKDRKGPLGQYADEIKKVGLNLDDEFENIAANGLRSLNDGLASAIANSENLGDVFKNVAQSIIADLIRIAIQQTIVNALMSATSLFGGGGGGGGALSIANIAKVGFKTAGARAGGGPVSAGSLYRINENSGAGNPEYFRPAMGGTVIPLGQVNQRAASQGAGITLNQTVNVDARGVNPSGFAEHIKAEVRKETMSIVGQGMRATLEQVPGRVAQANRYGQ